MKRAGRRRCDGGFSVERVDVAGEHVAGAALGEDQRRVRRVAFQLHPQASHLHVDGAVVHLAFVQPLKRRQGRRCAVTGKRLFKSAEIDHRVPLFRVWREHRDRPWPELLDFWGAPNLQVIGRESHVGKSAEEAGARSAARQAGLSEAA